MNEALSKEDQSTKILDRRFDFVRRVLDACVAESVFFVFLEMENDEKSQRYRREAWSIAEQLGYDFLEFIDLPASFPEGSELAEAYRVGQRRRVRENEEETAEQNRIERESLIASVLKGERHWDALALPSPTELLRDLTDDNSASVNGYDLWFEDDVTWFANPYGQEGALGNAPDIEMLRLFLTGLARGRNYGLVPH